MENKFLDGFRDGLPIALGYLAVSFSFGMTASSAGVPVWVSVMLSLLNVTSAGQFSALTLMTQTAALGEIAVSTLVINIRYALMSLVLTQRLMHMPAIKRMMIAFGVTDEIFTVSSTKSGKITGWYMLGLILFPIIGWVSGTLLGAVAGNILGEAIRTALSISLYAMFIAIVTPEAKKSHAVLFAVMIAVGLSCIIKWVPALHIISGGWAIIIASISAAVCAAALFPIKSE